MSSDHEQAVMEQDGAVRGEVPAPAAFNAKKLWRMARAVHLVLVRGLGKHQPKVAALGVLLHHMLSGGCMLSLSKRHHHLGAAARDHDSPALIAYLSAALSCRSMDAAAAVHPYPRHGAHGGAASSLSCRSMDPDAAVYQQYQYRPREVEFSCSTTPRHRRRSRAHRSRDKGLLLQQKQPQQQLDGLPEYASAVRVKTLFELMDGDEDDDGDMENAVPWATSASVGRPAPRQARITDSPFLAREEEEDEGSRDVVDRRADEFILWFHDQLRMQQQQQQQQQRPAARDRATYWVR